MATKKDKELNFEAAMERLEEIARILESGSEGLDGMLKLYAEGAELIRLCANRLDTAEQSVRTLQLQADGQAALVEFQRGGEEE
ncbi:MAG: exodeoxyribonuclease VII small subunit [Ruminococcaceae bacterium]|nr:exodeoxyribonuclease VII small subunit [Oscillospiraceae bacterium]